MARNLSTHFPIGFQFFGLGAVSQLRRANEPRSGYPVIVVFSIDGDESGKCIVGFDRRPNDPSMVIEVANILASKLVSSLCENGGLDVTLSPPVFLDIQERQFSLYAGLLSGNPDEAVRHHYLYQGKDEKSSSEKFNIQVMFLSDRRGSA